MNIYDQWYSCNEDLHHSLWLEPCFTAGEVYEVLRVDIDGTAFLNNFGAEHYVNCKSVAGWRQHFVPVNPLDKDMVNKVLAKQAVLVTVPEANFSRGSLWPDNLLYHNVVNL